MGTDCIFVSNAEKNDEIWWYDDDAYAVAAAADDTNGGDGVQQSQVSSSEPGPSILASNVIGPLLLEVWFWYWSNWTSFNSVIIAYCTSDFSTFW